MIEIVNPDLKEKTYINIEDFLNLLEKYRLNTIPKFSFKIDDVEIDLDKLLVSLK